MEINKMSDNMYFFETETKENKRYYGYIIKKPRASKFKIKCVIRSPHNVRSIYLEASFKRKSFSTIEECTRFLENL